MTPEYQVVDRELKCKAKRIITDEETIEGMVEARTIDVLDMRSPVDLGGGQGLGAGIVLGR